MESGKEGGVYVVFGGTGGIGSEVCRRLAQAGRSVVVASRDGGRCEELAGEIDGQAFVLDARHPEEVSECVDEAVAAGGTLAGLVNCVGSILLKPTHLTTDEEWAETVALNLTSSFAAVRAGARAMRKTGGGAIVLLSSAAARIGLANHGAIAAAKAGVEGLAKAAAATFAARSIRVNVVAPGLVRTKMSEKITASAASEKASLALHPLGRLGEPADVASAICWLLDPAQSWITGEVLSVDGGLANLKPPSR